MGERNRAEPKNIPETTTPASVPEPTQVSESAPVQECAGRRFEQAHVNYAQALRGRNQNFYQNSTEACLDYWREVQQANHNLWLSCNEAYRDYIRTIGEVSTQENSQQLSLQAYNRYRQTLLNRHAEAHQILMQTYLNYQRRLDEISETAQQISTDAYHAYTKTLQET